ncbi:MAG: MmcQ/YjbR family DNA-binding protein [Rhodopseudomonas palustris]|uniref:MmcQ/YjbR family DNA-binding protein n=1 Tax=Rhodopseudomonas palustris TaxID=1076 RepID=A0A933S1D3_RHOPL|nr:MmcQ/YjbR family DNA-binding protein [Rhodopseudomonas palustris]
MATAAALRRMALALEGTVEAPHFDRAAFKTSRIYVTLAGDGLTANLRFTPDQQALKCAVAPDAFSPVANAWGAQGWTTALLAELSDQELQSALEAAWQGSRTKQPRTPNPKRKRSGR